MAGTEMIMAFWGEPTPYMEAHAILAAQNGDMAELERILAEMLPSELVSLADAADRLAETCRGLASGPPPRQEGYTE